VGVGDRADVVPRRSWCGSWLRLARGWAPGYSASGCLGAC
jgi:hypothetical protein